MQQFWDLVIDPAFKKIKPKHIIEIGADEALNTCKILKFCAENNSKLTSIDPFPRFDVEALKAEYGNKFALEADLSLNALPKLDACDVALIDGDHNWYTVYNELKLLEKATLSNKKTNSKGGAKFPVCIFHDIGYPYGRRDMYYNPDNIPAEFRQPYAKRGISPYQSELLQQGGLNPHLDNAIYEGGERNGVLTAVEDFIKESAFDLVFHKINAWNGLGILFENTKKNNELFDLLAIQDHITQIEERKLAQVNHDLQQVIGMYNQLFAEHQQLINFINQNQNR